MHVAALGAVVGEVVGAAAGAMVVGAADVVGATLVAGATAVVGAVTVVGAVVDAVSSPACTESDPQAASTIATTATATPARARAVTAAS
jgi:hypothetical protein